jgi:hypothetical protein
VTRRRDHLGISRSVVVDLKSQELIYRLYRFGIGTGDAILAPGS